MRGYVLGSGSGTGGGGGAAAAASRSFQVPALKEWTTKAHRQELRERLVALLTSGGGKEEDAKEVARLADHFLASQVGRGVHFRQGGGACRALVVPGVCTCVTL